MSSKSLDGMCSRMRKELMHCAADRTSVSSYDFTICDIRIHIFNKAVAMPHKHHFPSLKHHQQSQHKVILNSISGVRCRHNIHV